jgi:hypothetical protein
MPSKNQSESSIFQSVLSKTQKSFGILKPQSISIEVIIFAFGFNLEF